MLVLEARDRPGGRTWTRAFAGTGPPVEIGGSWFTPEHVEVPSELARYGLATRTYGAAVRRCAGAREASCATACRCRSASSGRSTPRSSRSPPTPLRCAPGTLGERGSLSCADYLRRLGAPAATREFLAAWWVMIGGTDPERGAVVDALAAIAAHGGPTGLLTALRHAPAEGWSTLAERMAQPPGMQVRYGAELRAVRQDDAGVELALADGIVAAARRARCSRCPSTRCPAIGFDPALPAGDRRGARIQRRPGAQGLAARARRAGRRARGGRGEGLHWLYADRALDDGDVLLLGFGYEDPAFDPGSRTPTSSARCAPSSPTPSWSRPTTTTGSPIRCARHLGDGAGRSARTCSRRSASRRTGGSRSRPRTWRRDEAGWIEGALIAGAAAARWALRSTAANTRP